MSKHIEDYFSVYRARNGFLVQEDLLVYLSNESGTDQIYTKNLATGEVNQVTNLENRVWSLAPMSVGATLFFTSDNGGDEQEQLYCVDYKTKECRNITANPAARYNFGGVLPDNKTIIASSTARNPANYDIVAVDMHTGEEKILLENHDNYNMPAALSPSGRYLLYNKLDGISENYLWMLDLETGQAEKVHQEGSYAQYISPCWLPDSSGFYLLSDFESDFLYLASYGLADKKLVRQYETNWDLDCLSISGDGCYLAFTINEDGYSRLLVKDLRTNEFVSVPQPPNGLILSYYGFEFAGFGAKLVFNLMSVKRPGNIWVLDIAADSLVKETPTVWSGELSAEDLVEPELHRFSSFDGLSVPYWLYRKPGTPAGAPVVLEIHGGPEGQEYPIYSGFLSYLVNQGFVIVAPNVRGSVGYGKAYHHLDDVEKRLDSIKDVQALVEHLVAEGQATPGKIGIMGASYGGFMTLSGITEYPDLFSAAIDTVGMSNLETFLENTAEYRRAHRESEYGSLARHRDVLRRVSPFHKADRIVTPLMVVHGANDPRVPVSEAEQIVKSLQDRGVAVQFLCYEDEGHGLAKRKNQLDCYPKAAAFLKEHLQ